MNIDFYTTDWCGDCVRSKALLKKLNVDFNEINVDVDQEANEYIKSLQVNQRRIPTCLLYTSPSPRDYAASRMPSSA